MSANLLDRTIKLIWDFKGPAAAKTAEHYLVHLKEYVDKEELKYDIYNVEHVSSTHSLVFLVVAEFEMPQVRDSLKPHRGQLYQI
ncbi:hypothetical protein [Croceivirga radicis]|uniref:Uncharacterized protein n=1 Tax=Croceivirga radicis TaxID=1929488 RepID=A0A1V6LNJ0_9FLAO|nr:hypothetical protein [Croceivirga radicis]OQD41770.1 hypothetical protein BUL40_14330 [Croceivirga radicis]